MCGRFTLNASPDELVEHFDLDQPPSLTARFNIAPSQLVAVVATRRETDKRGLALLKWGFVPDWSPDGKPGPINARGETVAGLPTFSDAFRQQRCIIPATGFYEWKKEGTKKRPYHFRLKGSGVMGFAALWSVWRGDGTKLLTTCLITTAANDVVRPLHDRMPVILSPDDYDVWLDNGTPLPELKKLLRPYSPELMEVVEANPLVNSPKNEGPALLEPAA